MKPRLWVLTAIVLLLVACGADDSDRLGGLPSPPPGAVVVPEDVLPFEEADVAQALAGSMEVNTVDVEVYQLAADVQFEEVETHYEALMGSGWQARETEALQQARAQGRQAALWGSDRVGEVLFVQYIPVSGGRGSLLIVLYASK